MSKIQICLAQSSRFNGMEKKKQKRNRISPYQEHDCRCFSINRIIYVLIICVAHTDERNRFT